MAIYYLRVVTFIPYNFLLFATTHENNKLNTGKNGDKSYCLVSLLFYVIIVEERGQLLPTSKFNMM